MPSKRQDLIASVGRATQAYQRATDGFDDEVGRRLGLNPTDLRCLDWLSETAMTAGELAEATGLSSAATTTLLDRLERKGFVQRERDTVDRRKVRVAMTPSGTGAGRRPVRAAGARRRPGIGAVHRRRAREGARLPRRGDRARRSAPPAPQINPRLIPDPRAEASDLRAETGLSSASATSCAGRSCLPRRTRA